MSKYDEIKAKFVEIWDKLTSSEKQKLSDKLKAKDAEVWEKLSTSEKQKLIEKLKNKIAEKWGKLKSSEREKISELLKESFLYTIEDLCSDTRRLVALIFTVISFSVAVGSIVNSGAVVYDEISVSEPLCEEVAGSEEFKLYQSSKVASLRKAYEAGEISYNQFVELVCDVDSRTGILNYIENSGNEDWIERSENVLTKDEYVGKLENNGKILAVGFGGAVASAVTWRIVDGIAEKEDKEEENIF